MHLLVLDNCFLNLSLPRTNSTLGLITKKATRKVVVNNQFDGAANRV